MHTDTLVVGGGLSGLAIADGLLNAGHDFQLVEARPRFGGRIHATHLDDAAFDLGPAWFWPHQPLMAQAAKRFGLQGFDQFSDGDIVAEDAHGQVRRGAGFASMAGSLRLDGGMVSLITALAHQLPVDRLHKNQPAISITQTNAGVCVVTPDLEISANRVVLALPPRIAAGLAFAPALSADQSNAMAAIPTWMAGHAKIVAIYDRPYWRDAGLSGDAQSRRGPMVEIHDASPREHGPYAIFGFVGIDPATRAAHHDEILDMAIAQLVRLFGPSMAAPRHFVMQDWAQDDRTSTHADQMSGGHPHYGRPLALQSIWDGQIVLGSSEMAAQSGGYLEGALEAAQDVVATCIASGTAVSRGL